MGRTNDKRIPEYEPIFEDTETHLSDEEWDDSHSNDMPIYHKRRTAGLWTALATLAVALAVVAGYGYSVINEHNTELAWLSGRQDSFSAFRGRMTRLESGLNGWKTRQASLAIHVKNLDAGFNSGLKKVRLGAAALVANTYQREQEALDQRTADLNQQIAQMMSQERTQQVHMAQLERELASTRQELATVRETYTRQLAALQEQQISSQRKLASIDNRLSTDQVDFSAAKNKDEEIVPGITLHLTRTNTAHQRFQGWIRLMETNRRIWVRGNPIERPVVFYPEAGGEAFELVITRVNQKGAAGYLLVPGDSRSQQANVASGIKSLTAQDGGSF